MLKYLTYSVVFQEVPDEISLALEITNCPHHCKNCHSPYLRDNIGIELTQKEINSLIELHPHITCICLMGGDSDHEDVVRVAKQIRSCGLKVAMYSGDDAVDSKLVSCLDYYKIGSYQEKAGPLSSKTTNQKFYKIVDQKMVDITYRFVK